MNKKLFVFILGVAIVAALMWSNSARASIYLDPNDQAKPFKAGDCIMVDQRSEADTTHVYTTNPDGTLYINSSYVGWWGRKARCEEIQFHVDHNTSQSRLHAWLKSVLISWYKNIGVTHFKNQTISTNHHEWFLIKDGVARRIPDWLTALSWGLLIDDRLSAASSSDFYSNVKIGQPLNFNDGPYASKIRAIWKDGDRDFSTLPPRLATEISNYVGAFTVCSTKSVGGLSERFTLLDWRWMLRNPGCSLAS